MPSNSPSPVSSEGSVTPPKRSWRNTFTALSDRNYRFFWMGSVSSFFAGQMQQPAQQWLAYELTDSPFKLGLVMAIQAIPMILLSLYSGVIIDRIQKRTIIIGYQIVNALLGITVAILIATGLIQYWHLLAVSFLNGANMAFYMPARNAIIAELVPREKIYNAVSLNNMGTNIAQIAGPAIAGVLIGAIGAHGAYFVAVAFSVTAASVFALLTATSRPVPRDGRSLRKNWVEGLRYIRVHNVLIILLAVECVVTLFGMSYQSLLPVFATNLNQGSEGYGFMLSAAGVGALLGSLFVASLGNFTRKGLLLLITCTVFGLVLVLFACSGFIGSALGLGSGSAYLATFWLVIIGISSNAFITTNNTLIQMNVSAEFRGRVNGVYGMVIALFPGGFLLAGTAAEYLGANLSVIIGGSVLTVFMLVMLIFTRRIKKLE